MKLKYNELHLKTKRTLTNNFFKQYNINYENIDDTILLALNNILSKPITAERRIALYEMVISKTNIESNLEIRFEKFMNTTANTLDFFKLKLGDTLGTEKYNNNNRSRGKGNTLEGQVEKYGLVEGTRRYNEMNSKRAHSLENFIRKHGEIKGKEMYKSTISKKGQSLERFINLYGLKEGEIRYNAWKESCMSTEENFIKRHGEQLGKQKWQEFKDKSKSTKENFIRRHGEVEGLKRYKLCCMRSANTKENFIRVHGITKGTEKWNNYKNSNAGYKASKESMEFFKPLTENLLNRGLELEDLWFGGNESIEFKIENNDKVYAYDYTILPLKIIFEYNGNHIHPSKELLGENWNLWKCAWTGESADEKHNIDLLKKQVAEKEGFIVLEIWDYEDKTEALRKCIKLIEERI